MSDLLDDVLKIMKKILWHNFTLVVKALGVSH